uniref:Uncharacterized protein n=1 Tax=Aegilops tauschii TaxID=37682 RepID=M8CTP2_AEGTA
MGGSGSETSSGGGGSAGGSEDSVALRWSSFSRGTTGKLESKSTLILEGLLEEALDSNTINLVLARGDGELIDMLPATDK